MTIRIEIEAEDGPMLLRQLHDTIDAFAKIQRELTAVPMAQAKIDAAAVEAALEQIVEKRTPAKIHMVKDEGNGVERKPRGRPKKAQEKVQTEPDVIEIETAAEEELIDPIPEAEDVFDEPDETITKDMLFKALTAHVAEHGNDATRILMKKHGKAEKVSAMDAKYYPAVYKAVTANLSA